MADGTGGDCPVERELKLDLGSEGAFRRLLEALEWRGHPVMQVNTFFDTREADLRRNRFALRIRRENGGYLLTLKGRRRDCGELVERLEVECRMEEADARAALSGIRPLAAMDYPPLRHLAREFRGPPLRFDLRPICTFTNERHPVTIEGGAGALLLEIDRTAFGKNRVDFELEAEFPDSERYPEQRKFLRNLFRDLSLPWIVSEKSKFQKALETP